ncbi:hypothetical protein ACFULT_22130 [Rhodococcus sp. NPDC057297]|uniref:hypothetical protein n=1 Tax=Rhodococcus sp. NPDC057297 TaxID=3346090 RepID=UPI00362C1304
MQTRAWRMDSQPLRRAACSVFAVVAVAGCGSEDSEDTLPVPSATSQINAETLPTPSAVSIPEPKALAATDTCGLPDGQNLTPDEIANSIDATKGPVTRETYTTGDFAAVVNETPPGGQTQFLNVFCDALPEVSDTSAPGEVLEMGYFQCVGLRTYSQMGLPNPQDESVGELANDPAYQRLLPTQQAASDFLCPQYYG